MKQRKDRDELLAAARKEIQDNEKSLSMNINKQSYTISDNRIRIVEIRISMAINNNNQENAGKKNFLGWVNLIPHKYFFARKG